MTHDREAGRRHSGRAVTSGEMPSRRARMLVVDDEELILRSLQRILGRTYDVHCVSSAAEALAKLNAGERFDVVFSDLAMPGMDGPQLHAAIRAEHPELARSVVFMTGGATSDEHAHFLERSGAKRLEKPFQLETLRALVDELLRR